MHLQIASATRVAETARYSESSTAQSPYSAPVVASRTASWRSLDGYGVVSRTLPFDLFGLASDGADRFQDLLFKHVLHGWFAIRAEDVREGICRHVRLTRRRHAVAHLSTSL